MTMNLEKDIRNPYRDDDKNGASISISAVYCIKEAIDCLSSSCWLVENGPPRFHFKMDPSEYMPFLSLLTV